MHFKYKVDKPQRSFEDISDCAHKLVGKFGPYRVVVAVGDDLPSLQGLALAKAQGLVEPILVGRTRHMRYELEQLGESTSEWQMIEERDPHDATRHAAQLVKSGDADILMRGKLLARDFFATLFDKDLGLHKPGVLWTNIVALKIKELDRLILLTDCALTVSLDLPGRLKLIQNATDFIQFLGVAEPKISLLAAVETVTPGMPVSLEEAVIAKMSERGQFPKGVSVDGPLSLDLSLSLNAVKKKKMNSVVAGAADVLVVDSIQVGNLLFKSLITLCGAASASVIVGAPFPIILTSRSEYPENIINSFVLSIMMVGEKH